jgi:hypothetical protein
MRRHISFATAATMLGFGHRLAFFMVITGYSRTRNAARSVRKSSGGKVMATDISVAKQEKPGA